MAFRKANEEDVFKVLPYLKSRKNVRKKILGKDFPPEAKNAPNKRTGTRNKGSLVKYARNEIPATTTAQVNAIAFSRTCCHANRSSRCATPRKRAIMHGNYSAKYSNSCPR